ncbi:MAG: bifunctional folylpolyglutamate synthase/dihydrofolate synthase [Candidatus Omnitrophica bacterium]|nr:bifunctional folylpolyglutamate synthase/dihydrofolate synthase [Candidatus Omnitrophota bacterium]
MAAHSPKSDRYFLEKLNDFGIKLGLEKTFALLRIFGDPQKKFLSVLIAGTNGKGSVARALSQILHQAGYRVGLYTSPHLVDLRERIVINMRPISRELFSHTLRKLRQTVESSPCHLTPTFFEALTVIAMTAFAEKKIEVGIVEVGMGGRFDATNVVPACLSVITSVSRDHIQYLGPTLRDIAREKAGIIKPGNPVICASHPPEVLSVIRQVAKDRQCPIFIFGQDFSGSRKEMSLESLVFDFQGEKSFSRLKTKLVGDHQVENLSLAVAASLLLRQKGLYIGERDIRLGLEKVFWPARLQLVRRKPLILLDGAHNEGGLKALTQFLSRLLPGKRFLVLTAMLKDKEWQKMLRLLLQWNQDLAFTGLKINRGLAPELMAQQVTRWAPGKKVMVFPETRSAWKEIKASGKDWVICGSLYLAGEILKLAGRTVFSGRKLPCRSKDIQREFSMF